MGRPVGHVYLIRPNLDMIFAFWVVQDIATALGKSTLNRHMKLKLHFLNLFFYHLKNAQYSNCTPGNKYSSETNFFVPSGFGKYI